VEARELCAAAGVCQPAWHGVVRPATGESDIRKFDEVPNGLYIDAPCEGVAEPKAYVLLLVPIDQHRHGIVRPPAGDQIMLHRVSTAVRRYWAHCGSFRATEGATKQLDSP